MFNIFVVVLIIVYYSVSHQTFIEHLLYPRHGLVAADTQMDYIDSSYGQKAHNMLYRAVLSNM